MLHLEENVMTEAHAPIEKRKIVNRFLTLLTKQQPQMYYATTSEVAQYPYHD